MNRLIVAVAESLIFGMVFLAAQSPTEDEKLKKDLTAVIALHGLPCGEVVAVTVQGENDYAASCKDGNRYHVYLNAAGRVVVEKQKSAAICHRFVSIPLQTNPTRILLRHLTG